MVISLAEKAELIGLHTYNFLLHHGYGLKKEDQDKLGHLINHCNSVIRFQACMQACPPQLKTYASVRT